jgi:hypothetical protein
MQHKPKITTLEDSLQIYKKKNDKLAEAYQFDNNRVTQIEKKNHTN